VRTHTRIHFLPLFLVRNRCAGRCLAFFLKASGSQVTSMSCSWPVLLKCALPKSSNLSTAIMVLPPRILAVLVIAMPWHATATIRMPEEFNVQTDFEDKEKWRNGVQHAKCDLCKITVGNTYDAVGESSNEDDIYDHIDKICDVEDLYNKHELKEPVSGTNAKWAIVVEQLPTARDSHHKRWQTHAMKELCDNIIRPNDDDIKDFFLKVKRKNLAKSLGRDGVTQGACEKMRLCSKPRKSKKRSTPKEL